VAIKNNKFFTNGKLNFINIKCRTTKKVSAQYRKILKSVRFLLSSDYKLHDVGQPV